MLTIPQYLLESSFCLLIFYGFYALFLRKETFFQLNRAYLVLTPALSLSIPLLNISFQKDAPAESFEAFLYPAIQSANNINDLVWEQMRAPSPVFSLSVADILMTVYLIGVFLMAFTLLRGLWNLTRIIRNGKRSKNNEFTLVETQNNFPAASFFGYIFWNQQITDEQKLILEHEKVHIRQWHSLDVLLMEICVIIKWFNPLIYWFRNALRATHEYIADQYVIQQKSNVQDYATLLVNQQKSLAPNPLTNTFYSLTTKRLKMMLQRPSNKAYAMKYLMIIPMISALMLLFSFNLLEEIPKVSESLSEINAAINDLTETTVFEIEEKAPDNLLEQTASFFDRNRNNKVHFGEQCFSMYAFQQMQNRQQFNIIENQELLKLLQQKITFTNQNLQLNVEGIELFIPKLNGGDALQIHTSKSEDYKFSKEDLESLTNRLTTGDKVLLNFYGEHDTYITEFRIKEDRSVENEHDYQLYWGETEIPISYHSNVDVPVSNYEMQLQDFIKMVRQPIRLTKSGKPFMPEKLYFSIHGKNVLVFWGIHPEKIGTLDHLKETAFGGREEQIQPGAVISYKKPESEPIKIVLKGKEKMVFSEEDYESIFQLIDGEVTVNIKTMDDFMIATSIKVFTPSSKYFPPHSIRMPASEVFNYQLISPIEGRPILKIDTIKSAKTARLFRDKSKHKIIHIPNFQTYERVLDEKKPTNNDDNNSRPIIYNSITDADLLPNLIVENPTDLQLNWGNLSAALESDNLALKEFYQNISKTPKLLYQGQELAFEKIRMTIICTGKIYTKSFKATDFGTAKMTEILSKVENKTSIYFDKIEINDKGVTKHLQQRFLFKVGNQVLKSSFGKTPEKELKITNSNIQIKWGKYIFNCKESIVDDRKVCDCGGKYLRKADLKKINKKGFEFVVNGNSQAFNEVNVYTHGFVYCKKEDLMISSDLQRTYNPKACIWNAFDEGERGWVRFKSKDYDGVHFTFSVESDKGNKTIAPPYLKIDQEKVNLPSFRTYKNEKLKFTFAQIKQMLNQQLSLHTFGEISQIGSVKVMVAKDRLQKKFENFKELEILQKFKDFYPDEQIFYMDYYPSLNKNKVDLIFQLDPNDNIFKKVTNEFSWGEHQFSFKDPLIKVTKAELVDLFQNHQIKNYLGNPVEKISGIRFHFNDSENIIYGKTAQYRPDKVLNEPHFKKQFDLLQAGDLINIVNVFTDWVKGGLCILIVEDKNASKPLFKITEGINQYEYKYEHPKVIIYRNHQLSEIIAQLMDLPKHTIKINEKDKNVPLNLTYLPVDGLDAKKDLLRKIKTKYPFTIKKKIVEKEGWFLSGGDAKKLEQYRQKNLPTNLTLFIEDNSKKGLETLGPVNYDWFVNDYLSSKYQIDIINLTDFKGKYVFPLDTKNFKSLQQQLKQDFDLDLKKQRRSMEIKELVFE